MRTRIGLSANFVSSLPILVGLWLFVGCSAGQAQSTIRTDASWSRIPVAIIPSATATSITSRTSGTVYEVSGHIYTISQNEGRVAGSNLFHSLDTFRVGQGDAAVFTTHDPSLRNVIARVSGALPTTVNGLLMLQSLNGGNPNFFLVNPAGIAFGAGAQIDVPGALHLSTANSLNFVGSTTFKAGQGSDSTLTVAAPEKFGFVASQPTGKISFTNLNPDGSRGERPGFLLGAGGPIEISAGAIEFDSSDVQVLDGDINIASVGGKTTTVPLNGKAEGPLFGPIGLANATLSVVGNGSIQMQGGRTTLVNSIVFIDSATQAQTGRINLTSSDLIELDGAIVSSSNTGKSDGGIGISARNLIIDGRSSLAEISTKTLGENSKDSVGAINVNVQDTVEIVRGGIISVGRSAPGIGGGIDLRAKSIVIDGRNEGTSTALIATADGEKSIGGPIKVVAEDGIELRGGGQIATITSSTLSAGSVDVQSRSITLNGLGTSIQSGPSDGGLGGDAGAIRLLVGGPISIEQGARISSTTFGTGAAGAISVEAESLSVNGGGLETGIFSQSARRQGGDGGPIVIDVANVLSLSDGGQVSSSSSGAGAVGSIEIRSPKLFLEGQATGIFARAFGSEIPRGSGGIALHIGESMLVKDGAAISSETAGSGSAGPIALDAGEGEVRVTGGARIASSTSGMGEAGTISLFSSSLVVDGEGSGVLSEALFGSGGRAGALNITATERVALSRLGRLGITNEAIVDTPNVFLGSSLSVQSPKISLTGGASITAESVGNVNAGRIVLIPSLDHDSLVLEGDGTGKVTSSIRLPSISELERVGLLEPLPHHGKADAGGVSLTGGSLDISGVSVLSQAQRGTTGAAGGVRIQLDGSLSMFGNARVGTDTFSVGDAGSISISAHNLVAEASSITSISASEASGNAGSVHIEARNAITLANGAQFSTSTQSPTGRAGDIDIRASRVIVDGAGSAIRAAAESSSSGYSGNLHVVATSGIELRDGGSFSVENAGMASDPGSVERSTLSVFTPMINIMGKGSISAESRGNVTAGTIKLRSSTNGDGALAIRSQDSLGQITSSTYSVGDAGNVEVVAQGLLLSGVDLLSEAKVGSAGSGGSVNLMVQGEVSTMGNSRIATDTSGGGSAGSVMINAGNLSIDGSEISSNALGEASADAGNVSVQLSGALRISDSGRITSSTQSRLGAGGSIDIRANEIHAAGANSTIRAEAAAGSSGRTGNISVSVSEGVSLASGATLSIENSATSPRPSIMRSSTRGAEPALIPSTISIRGSEVTIEDSRVSAGALGDFAASNIEIVASNAIKLRNSSITTTALDGDGGNIQMSAGRLIALDRSQVSTSVLGAVNGNGGDITLASDALLMRTGFIQANTSAPTAFGGNVVIDVDLLVAAGSLLFGSEVPIAFTSGLAGINIIQAASPEGVSGKVAVTVPVMDVAGNLRGLSGPARQVTLERNLCQPGKGSSFTERGRGGLRMTSTRWIRAETERSKAMAEHGDGRATSTQHQCR